MINRDGSLSTFPLSVDQFPILFPFGKDRINGTNPLTRNDLERSDHVNKYSDACLNIENFLSTTIGGNLQSTVGYVGSGATVPIIDFLFSRVSSTQSISGSSNTFTFTVPSEFGSSPFTDWNFMAVPQTTVVSPVEVVGIGGKTGSFTTDSSQGYLQAIFNKPQITTKVNPVSGRVFQVTVDIYNLSQYVENFTGTFFDSGQRTYNSSSLDDQWQENIITGAPFGFSTYVPPYGQGYPAIWGSSLGTWGQSGGTPNAGLIIPSQAIPCNDCQVSCETYGFACHSDNVINFWNISGLFTRYSGTPNNSSFYALVFNTPLGIGGGFGASLPSSTFTLYRVNNADITLVRAGLTNDGSIWNWQVADSHVTALASGSWVTSEYSNWVTPAFYSLTASGNSLIVQQSLGDNNWRTIVNYTDSSGSALTNGFSGLFSLAFNQNNTYGFTFYRNIYITPLSGGLPQINLDLLYLKTGDTIYTENIS